MGEEEGKEHLAVDEESSLTSVIRRISVLISHSNSIKVFHGKWKLIRCKLEELTLGSAIVVSKPSFGCCKDDMKFYVNDLLTRMKVGGSDMKIEALKGLSEVRMEDDKYVKIVIGTGEIVGILVDFLEFTETEIQEESIKTISVIAGFDFYKGVLVGAGTVAPLIRVLESGSELGKKELLRFYRN